ncbi:release factor glutamine methyltransferase [Rubricella aquisinus]|uniref:Release factor glutamine methyltransferase n=1 Tax=Rubricella aquisinus TaxID=2028108 RepID=A0A840WZ48_9RHOB|nr:peptide chain release factor N(5)-glutamine methyltransferase [Rubricella aquisinus]MBB5514936.1 release factor glutamine methyltransferase [Rubricella aquisinus]
MTRAEALAQAAGLLRAAGIADPQRDAAVLLGEVFGGPMELRARPEAPMTTPEQARYDAMIAARAEHRPVSHILGWREFYGRRFRVTPDVLDPRPETEDLIALALTRPATRILDLGTGSGAIAVTLLAEWPQATGVATDISAPACAVARENAAAHDVAGRLEIAEGSWFAPVTGQYDLILTNPPYIAAHEMADLTRDVRDWEPHLALTPGGDGLAAYRAIAADLARFLAPGGRALFEIGYTQGADVMAILREAGFGEVSLHYDLGGQPRIVAVEHRNPA